MSVVREIIGIPAFVKAICFWVESRKNISSTECIFENFLTEFDLDYRVQVPFKLYISVTSVGEYQFIQLWYKIKLILYTPEIDTPQPMSC